MNGSAKGSKVVARGGILRVARGRGTLVAAFGLAAALGLLAVAARTPRAAAQVAAPAPPPHPTCVAVAGNRAVTTDEYFQVLLWDLTNLAAPPDPLPTHNKKASYVVISSGRVFSASFDGVVQVSPLAGTHNPVWQFREHWAGPKKPEVWAVAVSTDGSRAVSSTNDGQILVWKTAGPYTPNSVEADLRTQINSEEEIGGLVFIPGNKNRFLSGHADGQLILWDVSDLANVQRIDFTPNADKFPINSVAVNSTGTRVATGSFNKNVEFWDVAARAKSTVQPNPATAAHDGYVWRVAFSPDDKKVASAGEDGKVKVWNASTGAFIREFDAGGYGTMGVAWKDKNTVVFTGDGATAAVQTGNVP